VLRQIISKTYDPPSRVYNASVSPCQ
jgi:hypothetical protein